MRSMTGYGRGERTADGVRVAVEMRSVNRKQAEIGLRLPAELEPLENRIRDEVYKAVARGRVEVSVALELPAGNARSLLNRELAAAFAKELAALGSELGLAGGVTLDSLMRCPGVVQSTAAMADPDTFWPVVSGALGEAIKDLNAMRDQEGAALAADLGRRIQSLRQAVGRIRIQAPEVTRRFREQLRQRICLAGLENVSAEDERVLKEVVFFADRSDINEELTRLDSHFEQFEGGVRSADPVGRKLDFLAQEMNREINTIGSKANDALIAADVVLLKTELERFREQAQNVE
jgi:uncharacterized protein (TIGR00255 family)